jgi:putative hemolysin
MCRRMKWWSAFQLALCVRRRKVTDPLWFLLVFLLLLDMLFTAVRVSLVNARLPYLMNLNEQHPGQVTSTIKLLESTHLRATLRLSVTLVRFLLIGVAWFLIGGLDGGYSLPVVLLLLAAAALILLAVEFFVEGLVLHDVEGWAIRLTWLGRLTDFILKPFSWFLTAMMGKQPRLESPLGSVTEDELKTWVEVGQNAGSLEKGERKMIFSIFQFGETLAREIMVPRIDVFALDITCSMAEAIQKLTQSGHSRLPVYEETIDNIIGLLYAKDLLRAKPETGENGSLRRLLRPAYFVPEAKKVDELLREMQARRIHMAIVVDEYGGMAGLVTLEDIVEEIVGEIRDEYDQSEELLYQQISPDEYTFQGRIDIDDLNEILGTHLTREVADTLGGFLYGVFGRIPVGGESVDVEDWTLTVEQVSGRRIRKVRAKRRLPPSEFEEGQNDAEQRNTRTAD